MRAVVQHGPKDLRVEEQAIPEPGPGEVLVRVRATGICGSDLHFWKEATYGTGVVLGHEIAGEIAALGSGVSDLEVGALGAVYSGISCGRCARCTGGLDYYCQDAHGLGSGPQGGLGEYVVAPAQNFLSVSADSEPGAIAFSEPLANGLRCLDFPEAHHARSAVVIGAGPIGLSCLVAARRCGVKRAVVIEGRPLRREAARALGADVVLHPATDDVRARLREEFPLGADLVIEAVGLPQTIRSSFGMARPHGTVALMGVCLEPVEVKPIGWLVNELTLRSSLGCSRDDQREALRMLARQELDPQPLLTRRIGIEDVPNALVELASGADEIKVIVEHEHA
jgi:2-desacetyl-2-hydroxyethyl bacteriochlorophyllide A dehydrogenase